MLKRQLETYLKHQASQFKALVVLGPRQSGKTTLVKACFPDKPYISLENPVNRNFAATDPVQFLKSYPEGVILDEVQRVPELMSWLQQEIDESNQKSRYILTGSNNLLLQESITQTLAGRIAITELSPFSQVELYQNKIDLKSVNESIWYGGYPPIIADKIPPNDWFPSYIRTYIERDVRMIKNINDLFQFERFVAICAGRIGQEINFLNIGNALGLDQKTVKSWIGVLQSSYIAWLLPPWMNNYDKRIIKSPKLYFYDTGLACALLNITKPSDVKFHFLKGALFENMILNEYHKSFTNKGQKPNLHFWREISGTEIDLILDQEPIEIKSSETIANDWLANINYWTKLTGLAKNKGKIIYGGEQTQLRSNGKIQGWVDLVKELAGE